MNIKEIDFMAGFLRMANDGWLQNWHERNGGNISYRLTEKNVQDVKEFLSFDDSWQEIGTDVPALKGEFFLVTGSGKYMRNVQDNPEDSVAIIELNESGSKYRICWGLVNGGRPTSELPTHLMNHEVKVLTGKTENRVIYHAHPANTIALTYILPVDSQVWTRELWESATECAVVFPEGVQVVPWMVPGGREIAVATSHCMKECDAVIWTHHGLFCSGESFDSTFGLMHTIEKAAEILIKVLSVSPIKRQTITHENLEDIAKAFKVNLSQ